MKDYKAAPLSSEQVVHLTNPLVGFITTKENIRMKILEIKILEEFTEGDDEIFENDYAKLMNLLIINVIRTTGRSQTISNAVQSKILTALDYLKNRSNYAGLNENVSEDDEVKMKKAIPEKSQTQTIGDSVKSNTLKTLHHTNRLANYSGLKRKPIEPKNVSDNDEVKTRKITRGREKSQSQTIRSIVCNEKAKNSKIEPEDDKMKMQKVIREKGQSYTPVLSSNFAILPKYSQQMTKNMLNETPMEAKEDLSAEKEVEMLEINFRKISLHTDMQLKNLKK